MYQAVTGKIFGTVRYSGTNSTVRTDLIFLTLDLNSNRVNDLTSVDLKFFNENEVPHSTSISFYCWKEFDPRELDPSMTSDNPSWGLRGLVKSNAAVQGGNPSTLLGMVETREGPFIESVEIPDVPVTICQYLPVLGFTCLTEVETVTAQFPLVRQYSYLLYNDNKSSIPARLKATFPRAWGLVYNKYYVDELYQVTIVRGALLFSRAMYWVDQNLIDGLVNLMGLLGRSVAYVDAGIDKYIVDGAVNGLASLTWNSGRALRRIQTGHIQSYLYGALGGAIAFVIIQYVIR